MGTYATSKFWTGLSIDEFDDLNTTREQGYELAKVLEKIKSKIIPKLDNRECGTIYMHGEAVGYGITFSETSWSPEIGPDNEIDLNQLWMDAEATKKVLWDIFQDLEIDAEPKVYHHIDLGG